MKYVVKLRLEQPNFKSDYRRTVISFFKYAISKYMDGEFYDFLYNSGANQKSLVWSIRFTEPKFSGKNMELGGTEVEMTLKMSDAQTALVYYSALLEMKGKAFPVGEGNAWILEQIKMVREEKITQPFAMFKVLSPICLKEREEKEQYLSVEDENFLEEMKRKLRESLPQLSKEIEELKGDFRGLRKTIVRAYGMKIPASVGTFALAGDIQILQYILSSGVGSKRNSGFGLVEFVM